MLTTWGSCALKAKFAEIDGLPRKNGSKAVFGVCCHYALQHYNQTGDVDLAVKLFLEVWDEPEMLGVAIDVWNKYTTFGGLRTKGVEIIKAFHDQQRFQERTVVAVEHRFLVPFGDHELSGEVDCIEVKKNHRGNELLAIVDYKTTSRQPNFTELLLNTQFSVYIWASLQKEFWLGNGDDFPPVHNGEWWFEMLKGTPRRGIWVHLWNNAKEMDAGGRDDQDFGRVYSQCLQVERAIRHEVYVPTISGESCSFCDYANGPCPTRVPTRDEWEKARPEVDAESWL